MIINNKHGIHELPHELSNDLRLRILENQEILKRCQIFIEFWPSAQSSSQNGIFVNTSKKNVQKLKLNFYCKAPLHTNTKVCLMYFDQDCLWKKYFAFNSSQSPSKLICFTVLVTLTLLDVLNKHAPLKKKHSQGKSDALL